MPGADVAQQQVVVQRRADGAELGDQAAQVGEERRDLGGRGGGVDPALHRLAGEALVVLGLLVQAAQRLAEPDVAAVHGIGARLLMQPVQGQGGVFGRQFVRDLALAGEPVVDRRGVVRPQRRHRPGRPAQPGTEGGQVLPRRRPQARVPGAVRGHVAAPVPDDASVGRGHERSSSCG